MTNQLFCYWLQGFFEISETLNLTKEKIVRIQGGLSQINQPLGEFTGWLNELLIFFQNENYREPLINFYLIEIKERLNYIFFHVIDNSYDMTITLEESRNIHKGVPPHDQ